MSPDVDIQYLKGVGPRLGDLFKRKGLNKVRDLLEFYPRTYEDRRAVRDIASLKPDEVVSLKAQVVSVRAFNLGRSNRKMYEVVLRDQSAQITCKYFRVPYRGYFERFHGGQWVRVSGKVTFYRSRLEFHHPDLREDNPEDEITDILVPIYVEIEGLSSQRILNLIRRALGQIDKTQIPETLPPWVQKKYNLCDRWQALYGLHHPPSEQVQEFINFRSTYHHRLIFEEFFWLELFLATRRTGFQKEKGIALATKGTLAGQLQSSLPFQLTQGQVRVFHEIKTDFQKPHPMHRLVQGDVGCGKTLVAFMASALVIEEGYQACLMAPTEILAEQHFLNAQKLLQPLGIQVGLLTGKMKATEKKENLCRVKIRGNSVLHRHPCPDRRRCPISKFGFCSYR